MPSSPPLSVVCALIERKGRVLIAQRPPHKHLALVWEFPGGKIEAGETAPEAVRREIREELRCEIRVGDPLPSAVHTYPTVTIELIPFLATLDEDSDLPHPVEHCAIKWVLPEELALHDLAPADLPVVQSYWRLRRVCIGP
ncbi:MAG: (deoxy)nucleoside triphosphate pyrophosphohydrolase [Opitutaceae bacterium]|nr:(deoxy)nucleoside triphosphate pyrophosphohydrolase [Opitutaceae bacterium]